MKKKRKNESDGEEDNCLVLFTIVFGSFVLVPVICFFLYVAWWRLEEIIHIQQAKQAIREQCSIADYEPYDYYYDSDPFLMYFDHLPDEELQIDCEKVWQSTDWQCICTEHE